MWLVSNCSLTAVPFRSEVGTHATISGLYCQYSSPLLGLQLRQIHANQHSRAVHLKQQYDWIVCGLGLSDRQHARLSSLQSFRKTRKAFMQTSSELSISEVRILSLASIGGALEFYDFVILCSWLT